MNSVSVALLSATAWLLLGLITTRLAMRADVSALLVCSSAWRGQKR